MPAMVKPRTDRFCRLLPALALLLWAGAVQAAPHSSPRTVSNAPEIVQIPANGAAGDPISLTAYLLRPPGAGPFPAVVALHGCGGLFGQRGTLTARHREWGERLAAAGYAVLFPDSFTPRGVSEICTRHGSNGILPERERARDAFTALRWLRTQAFVRADAVGVLGWSNGGSTVLGAVDVHQPAREAATTPWRFAVAFYPGCRTADARRSTWRSDVPLLILIGEADNWTPAAPCLDLARKAKDLGEPVEIVTYPGAYHDFDAPGMALHEMAGIRTGSGKAMVGTDPAARAAAIPRAMDFMERLSR